MHSDSDSCQTYERHVKVRSESHAKTKLARTEGLIEDLVRTKVSLHGALVHLVASIVQSGFAKPGDKNDYSEVANEVRCGNSYGRGIHSSPSAEFAFTFSRSRLHAEATRPGDITSLRLIVCATLMGRARVVSHEDDWRKIAGPCEVYDSHVNLGGLEYIVFDSTSILPRDVIHPDFGAEELHMVSSSPEEKQREKQAKQAAPAKWFRYGFGPAKGTSFVIEEIGEKFDDEEN